MPIVGTVPAQLLLFSPYREINPLFTSLSEELGYVLDIREPEPAEALEIMTTLSSDVCDAVMCRGFTYKVLRDRFKIPVLNIPLSPLDVVQTLLPYKGKIRNAVLVLNESDNIHIDTIVQAIDIKMKAFYCRSKEELIETLHTIQRDNCADIVVGRFWCVKHARELGIPCVMFHESDYTVRSILLEAVRLAGIRREERQRYARMEAVVNTLDDGLFLLDEFGVIKSANSAAIAYAGKEDSAVVGLHGADVIPESRVRLVLETGRAVRNHLSVRDGKTVLWNSLPVILDAKPVGVVCQFSEARKVLESGGRVRSGMRSKTFAARYTFDDIKTRSPEIEYLKKAARIYASSDSSVLITGESGTGKELFAQSIHLASLRAREPFVAVNCAALPEPLLESELFGYEEGAFTGARRQGKPGLFELAHCGTFFLDEVAEMSPTVQARLLRVLQEKEIVRVGGSQVIPVQVRIVCATNQHLKQLVEQRKFRDDLYYRLSVLTLHLPPLRERPEDICEVGLSLLMALLDSPPDRRILEAELGPLLIQYGWPGNFRELHSIMERLALVANHYGGLSWPELLQRVLVDETSTAPIPAKDNTFSAVGMHEDEPLKDCLHKLERRIINDRLARFGQDLQRTARSLQVSRMTLWRKLQE